MKRTFIIVIAIIIFISLGIIFSRWWFDFIINSDLPDWLKWLFLKG